MDAVHLPYSAQESHMFLGEYHTNFTGQGRAVLPKKFRQELSGEKLIVLSRGLDGCIWGFPIGAWEKEAGKQIEVSATDKQARDLRRYLFSAAESIQLDSQGRFVIPKNLLIYAGLTEEVVLIGAGDHFEIWSPSLWQKALEEIVLK